MANMDHVRKYLNYVSWSLHWYPCKIVIKQTVCKTPVAASQQYIKRHSANSNYTSTNANLWDLQEPLNKFPDFFVQAFKIFVDSWKISMLLLYIWDDWPIFMISASNATAAIGIHPTKAWLSAGEFQKCNLTL